MELKDVILVDTNEPQDPDKAKEVGFNVVGTHTWDGPTPPGSFVVIDSSGDTLVRMSTPMFMAVRKSCELDDDGLRRLMCELLSCVETNLTCHNIEQGTYVERRGVPHMYCGEAIAYFSQVDDERFLRCEMAVSDITEEMVDAYESEVRSTLKLV